jgi:hypothetical protein
MAGGAERGGKGKSAVLGFNWRSYSLGGGKWHSLGAGTAHPATTASGVKVAKHPKGLTLTAASALPRATLLSQLHVRLFASVDRPRIATGVENAEPTTAARTADETGQQRTPPRPDFVSPALPEALPAISA